MNLLATINSFSIIIDFGLVVLIWMVQLIIYPSFLFYKPENLILWHEKYTKRIAIIVIPLMVFQLIFACYQLYSFQSIKTILNFCIVLFLWIFTFTHFAPLHFKISDGKFDKKMLHLLVKRNWIRTFLWTLLFLMDFFL